MPKHHYSAVPSEALPAYADHGVEKNRSMKLWKASRTQRFFLWTSGLVNLGLMLAVLSMLSQRNHLHSTSIAADHGYQWDPVRPAARTVPTKYKGTFIDSSSKYRGPGQDVDAEWNRFTDHPYIDGTSVVLNISVEDIAMSRKDLDSEWFNSTVKLESESGTGYMATLEVFHQLHCLNMLRMATYPDREMSEGVHSMKAQKFLRRNHLDHCIEILRQVLMCNSDLGLVTFHWVKGNEVPYPDFNTWHQCRDPEAVLRLARAHEMPLSTFVERKGGEIDMPYSP